MNHQDVRNQYLQVHGIDPVEIEVDNAFTGSKTQSFSVRLRQGQGVGSALVEMMAESGDVVAQQVLADAEDAFAYDDEPSCPAARHGRRHSNCTCEDSRDE